MTSFGSSNKPIKSFADLKGSVGSTSLNSANLREFVDSELRKSETLEVLVIANEHANCDSLPLRYGMHFETDASISLSKIIFPHTYQMKPDRLRIDAYFKDSTGKEQYGNFVIGYRKGFEKPVLITVWRNDANTEEHLSEVMKCLRERGCLSSQELMEWHPDYRQGKISSHADLMILLGKKSSDERIKQMESIVADSVDKTNKVIAERDAAIVRATQAEKKVASETDRADFEKSGKEKAQAESLQKSEVIVQKDEEIARLQRQSLMTPIRGEIVTPSNIAKILRVEEGVRGKFNQKAIILHMSDGTERVNNWERDYSARLQLAQTLEKEGRLVRTDVWNTATTNYSWERWFKNIYAVD